MIPMLTTVFSLALASRIAGTSIFSVASAVPSANSLIRFGTKTLVGADGVPVFDYFASIDMLNSKGGTKCVGLINSVDDYNYLAAPKAHLRVEMETADREEEVRVVDGTSGEYHRAIGRVASNIINQIFSKEDPMWAEDDVVEDFWNHPERDTTFWTHFIHFDSEGQRLLPALHRAGYLASTENFWDTYETVKWNAVLSLEGDKGHASFTDRRTGNYWIAQPSVAWALENSLSPEFKATRERLRQSSHRTRRAVR